MSHVSPLGYRWIFDVHASPERRWTCIEGRLELPIGVVYLAGMERAKR